MSVVDRLKTSDPMIGQFGRWIGCSQRAHSRLHKVPTQSRARLGRTSGAVFDFEFSLKSQSHDPPRANTSFIRIARCKRNVAKMSKRPENAVEPAPDAADQKRRRLEISEDGNNAHLVTPDSHDQDHPANLIPSLCAKFWTLGWVTGTGGGCSIRNE